MRFDDNRVDVSRTDRRGSAGRGGLGGLGGMSSGGRMGPGAAIGGGGGIIGLLVVLAITFLGGGDASSLGGFTNQTTTASGETLEQTEARCNTEGAIEQYDDCFAIKVTNEIDEVWTQEFDRRGAKYTRPELVLFDQNVQTGCGFTSSNVGPFYCPPDDALFIDLRFMEQLQTQLGAEGDYAKAYILAHEVGHHLQDILGTEAQMRQAQQQDPSQANELSVKLELQADCYAGVWSGLSNAQGNLTITAAELEQALNAAEAVGDDAIQSAGGGTVNPDTFTHGTSEQRRDWFQTGYTSQDIDSCNTFA